MNKRPIDKSKKSNIKCEHCRYWVKYTGKCVFTTEYKHKYYYNRCKNFEWIDMATEDQE